MDFGKLLFTLSYVKYKQFDFRLLVMGSLWNEKYFLQYYKSSYFHGNLFAQALVLKKNLEVEVKSLSCACAKRPTRLAPIPVSVA